MWTKEGDRIYIPLQKLTVARVNYPNNCLTLPLNKLTDIKGKHIQELLVQVKNFTGYNSIEIHFVGDTLDTGRHIKEHRLDSGGDVIKLTGQNRSTNYMIDITQRVLVEEDPTNTCIDYPNQEYSSYDECDNKNVKNLLPGLTPIWLSDDFADVTKQLFDENGTYYGALANLADGSHLSDCPLPCKTTRTRSKFLYESLGEDTFFDLQFSSSVTVSKTDLIRPTIASFLSEVRFDFVDLQNTMFQVGGSMGLWLGLGAVQVSQLAVNCLLMVVRNFKCS